MSKIPRDVIFAGKENPCGNVPQHRTGLVKLTISLLFGTIGDYLVLIGGYLELIATNWRLIGTISRNR
jgi:hypothetical protein